MTLKVMVLIVYFNAKCKNITKKIKKFYMCIKLEKCQNYQNCD